MISYRTAGFSLIATMAIAGIARGAIVDGLVSYWPFDGDLADVLELNNGTLVGTNTTASYDTGKFGQGIDLDGVNQYVDVGNSSTLDMDPMGAGDQTGSVSISAWFRVDSFGKDWQALVAKGEGSAYRVARRAGSNVMSYAGGVGDIPGDDLTGPDVNDGGLHHVVAITEDQVSTRLWVDGGLVATGGVPTLVNEGNSGGSNPSLFIGENPQATGRTWDGVIDDVAIWNRPLTDQEIAEIWNAGAGAAIGDLFVPPKPGDVNGDGLTNDADFEVIRMNFLLSATTREEGDLNRDGIVDFTDFRSWKSAPQDAAAAGLGSSASIPEPGTLLLVECALFFGFGIRRLSRRDRARADKPLKSTSV